MSPACKQKREIAIEDRGRKPDLTAIAQKTAREEIRGGHTLFNKSGRALKSRHSQMASAHARFSQFEDSAEIGRKAGVF